MKCRGIVRQLWKYVNDKMVTWKPTNNSFTSGYHEEWKAAKKAAEVEFFKTLNLEWVNTHSRSTFYDIDHLTPVVEEGGQCGEDNLRTLCLICHRKETKELRKRLKAGKASQHSNDKP